MALKTLLAVAAVVQAATGLVLMIHPPLLSQLLLGEAVSGVGMALGRVAGFALLALGLACWPDRESPRDNTSSRRALLTYNLLATLYLAYLGLGGQAGGVLLWPAVVTHALLTLLLARAGFGAEPVGVNRERT